MQAKSSRTADEKREIINEAISLGATPLALRRAMVKLGCSQKSVNRYVEALKKDPEHAFEHGNTGRKPATTKSTETKDTVINLYLNRYSKANITHFVEILTEDYGIRVSDSTVRTWLLDKFIVPVKSHKTTKKAIENIAKQIVSKTIEGSGLKPSDLISNDSLSREDAHPTRSRSKYFGEMIQVDASSLKWNGNNIWHLHLAIDDASSEIVGAYFDTQETLNGYYHVLYQILKRYGIPAMFYTDRRTVFEYNKKDSKKEEKDTFTQFAGCCKSLGIVIKCTSIGAAKGRIERANQSFQGRLPVELKRRNITEIADANAFLENEYISKYNRQFSLLDEDMKAHGVFATCPDEECINVNLAILASRKINNGHCIRFDNKNLIPVSAEGCRKYYPRGTSAIVIKAFDGNLYININDQILALEEILEHQLNSKEFDPEVETPKKKSHYIPPKTHPWRRAFYMSCRRSLDQYYQED